MNFPFPSSSSSLSYTPTPVSIIVSHGNVRSHSHKISHKANSFYGLHNSPAHHAPPRPNVFLRFSPYSYKPRGTYDFHYPIHVKIRNKIVLNVFERSVHRSTTSRQAEAVDFQLFEDMSVFFKSYYY